jgi:Ca2+-binding RTX toxin-like protein
MSMDDADDFVNFEFLNSETVRITANGTLYDFDRNVVTSVWIYGGGGNDQLSAASDETIPAWLSGDRGNDLLIGGNGNDVLYGFEGSDTLIGGDGNDFLTSGSDASTCLGDETNYAVCFPASSTEPGDSILGGDGDDTIYGDPSVDTIDGGAGINQIGAAPVVGVPTDIPYVPETLPECLQVDTSVYEYDPEQLTYFEVPTDDHITVDFVNATTARVTIDGTNFNIPRDRVTCVYIDPAAGDDQVTISSSVDVPTYVVGGPGNDTIVGGVGTDWFHGGDGDDSILGNDGSDTLTGAAGNDYLDGGTGADSVSGGDGDDTMVDGMGDDTLDGGVGNDTYGLSPGSDDVLRDVSGADTVSFARAARGVRLDLGRDAGQRQLVDANRNSVTLAGVFENMIGSRFADDLVGDAGPNRIDGGGGDDTLDGGGGDRTPFGGTASSTDRRAGIACDSDTLIGGAGHDWLDGGRGPDNLQGNEGNDVLVGDPGFDTLNGGGGNNRTARVTKTGTNCDGAIRSFTSIAGISFDPATGQLVVTADDAGTIDDTISVTVNANGFVEVTINGSLHSSDAASPDFDPNLADATGNSVLSILLDGGDGNDILTVGAGFDSAGTQITIQGGLGDDRLVGGSSAEVLIGGPGNDVLVGGAGDDQLVGNAGNDQFDGGRGSDTVDFSGSPRAVRVSLVRGTATGQGSDTLAAVENVIGSMFDDLISGNALANVLLAGDGNDVIRGGDGGDQIDGGDGNDQLFGDLGNDSLDGSAGNDTLRGGTGDDHLTGSEGVDQFSAVDALDQVLTDLLDRPLRPGRSRSSRR